MSYVKTSVGYRTRSKRSRVKKRRLFAFVLLATVGALAVLWNDEHSAGGRSVIAKTIAPPATHAAPAWSAAQLARMHAALRDAFAPALTGARSWSLAVRAADGQTIFSNGANHAVAPASVQKLIVAAGALEMLGPNYRYHTIFASDAPLGAGVLGGNLWLVGSGDPSLQSSDLRNGIATLYRAGLRRIEGGIDVDATALRGPGLNPGWNTDDDGQDYAAPTSAISVDGDTIETHQIVDGVDQPLWTPMQDVPSYIAGRMQTMLRARGIALAGRAAVSGAPLQSVVLWDHRSAPLRDLETHMLFLSDNHYAEQLLRTLGGEVNGEADDAGGVTAERAFLAAHGIPAPGLRLIDGSGLSHRNRVAAGTIVDLLASQEAALYSILPLGGREGTLADYDFTTALGRVRAKSGHLSDVSALAGYATTLHHGRVAFAFLIDGSPANPDSAIVRAIDRLVDN